MLLSVGAPVRVSENALPPMANQHAGGRIVVRFITRDVPRPRDVREESEGAARPARESAWYSRERR